MLGCAGKRGWAGLEAAGAGTGGSQLGQSANSRVRTAEDAAEDTGEDAAGRTGWRTLSSNKVMSNPHQVATVP